MKALDVATNTAGKAHLFLGLGFLGMGLYMRSDRTSLAQIEGLHSVGIKVFSIWEKGNPTEDGYFTAERGQADAAAAAAFARSIGAPEGKPIFVCVDYDADPGKVEAYLIAYHDQLKSLGYSAGVYGNGVTCRWAIDAGYADYGYLSQSVDFDGYEEFKSSADCAILQQPSATVLGFDVDIDEVLNEAVLW